ncbi:hypothetical protein SANTM175S_07174 [Streptomyces antimycoticus]
MASSSSWSHCVVLAVLVTGDWYVWRRLVRRDGAGGAGAPRGHGGAPRLPLLTVAALVSAARDAPFRLQQSWPGRATSGWPCSCT